MTGGIIARGITSHLTHHLILNNMLMGQMTPWPCPSRVSDVAVKCHWHVGVVCLCSRGGNGELL